MPALVTFKFDEDQIRTECVSMGTSMSFAIETTVLMESAPNLNTVFPPSTNDTYKI